MQFSRKQTVEQAGGQNGHDKGDPEQWHHVSFHESRSAPVLAGLQIHETLHLVYRHKRPILNSAGQLRGKGGNTLANTPGVLGATGHGKSECCVPVATLAVLDVEGICWWAGGAGCPTLEWGAV